MNTLSKLLISITLVATLACEDCPECFTPPEPFRFDLVDQTSGENIFTTGAYNSGQIGVKDHDGENVAFTFISENDLNLIEINSIGWKTEETTLTISLSDQEIFQLYVDAKRITEDCCSFTRYDEITIEGREFELSQQTGIYTIRN